MLFYHFPSTAGCLYEFYVGTLYCNFIHSEFWPYLNFLLEQQIKPVLIFLWSNRTFYDCIMHCYDTDGKRRVSTFQRTFPAHLIPEDKRGGKSINPIASFTTSGGSKGCYHERNMNYIDNDLFLPVLVLKYRFLK